jgi:hypothetical protein
MKPLNLDDPTCSPQSSNCVIWDGPDISCIKLCKGDSVTKVIYELAKELCKILEQLDVNSYDLECLDLTGCGPKDFNELIQLLIDRICALENIPVNPGTGPGTPPPIQGGFQGDCPNCEVNIAECFYYQNQLGDTITTMQLVDYVIAAGNRICNLIDQINNLTQVVQNHETRIVILENAPAPTFEIPKITPDCVLPSIPTNIDVVLDALEAQFCDLRTATGLSSDIYNGIAKQCPNLNNQPQLSSVGTMSSISGWKPAVTNLGESVNNLWLTLCDLRTALGNVLNNCCTTGCDTISLTLTASLNESILTLFINGVIPGVYVQCGANTSFTITDGLGNSIVVTGNLIAALNDIAGLTFNLSATPLNLGTNLTITSTPCLKNTEDNSQCQSILQYVIPAPGICPEVSLTAFTTSIDFSANISMIGSATYTVELWNAATTSLLQAYTSLLTGPTVYVGTFAGLSSSTNYNIRVKVVLTNGQEYYCPFTLISTLVEGEGL